MNIQSKKRNNYFILLKKSCFVSFFCYLCTKFMLGEQSREEQKY